MKKLDISRESPPINNKEYKKRLANAKSKYMDDYKNSNKKSEFMEEKYFNNLLNTYYEDYNKLKNKYNLKDLDDSDNKKAEINDEEYQIKKKDINQIFSGDLFDIQDFNFDFCDNLINSLPKENNFTLLKTTQNKEDYELRLKGFNQSKKNDTLKEENEEEEEDKVNITGKNSDDLNNIKNIDNNINNKNTNENIINNTSENNINNIARNDNEEKESIAYIENDEQFKENNDNYLKLNQQKIDEDLPLFSDIISSNYNKNYRIPFYEHNEEEELKKSQEEKYSDFEKEKVVSKEIKENDDDKENNLILINENKENYKFEDIIKNDFNGDYKIPEYKIQKNIQKEIETNQKKEEDKKSTNEENKANDINNNNDNNNINNNLPVMNDKINIKESGAFIENDSNKEKESGAFIENDEEKEKVKNENQENNNNKINYEEEFEKIDVDKLKEIDETDDENKKYNDFH